MTQARLGLSSAGRGNTLCAPREIADKALEEFVHELARRAEHESGTQLSEAPAHLKTGRVAQ